MKNFDFNKEEGHQEFLDFLKSSRQSRIGKLGGGQSNKLRASNLSSSNVQNMLVRSIHDWMKHEPGYIKSAYFDASAIVKLLIDDGSHQSQIDARTAFQYFCPSRTTGICFAEAMNVLKRKWLKSEIDPDQYRGAVYELYVMAQQGNLHVDPILASFDDLNAADDIVLANPLIDFADALQLVSVESVGKVTNWYLCTADKGLKDVAANRGISVAFLP